MKLLTIFSIFIASLLITSFIDAKTPMVGVTSYYHNSLHGNRTANGERYNRHSLTAAHRTLPFGTKVKVTDITTNKSVVVKINDRGPFVKGRVLDLSSAAADSLGIKKQGLAKVQIMVLSKPEPKAKSTKVNYTAKAKAPTPVVEPKPIKVIKPYDTIETLIAMLDEGEDKRPVLSALSL